MCRTGRPALCLCPLASSHSNTSSWTGSLWLPRHTCCTQPSCTGSQVSPSRRCLCLAKLVQSVWSCLLACICQECESTCAVANQHSVASYMWQPLVTWHCVAQSADCHAGTATSSCSVTRQMLELHSGVSGWLIYHVEGWSKDVFCSQFCCLSITACLVSRA